MPSWSDLIRKQETAQNPDFLRRSFLRKLAMHTGRNIIAYYSGFLTNPHPKMFITDSDMNGFMNAAYRIDKAKGLDLILHTPGGGVSATRAIGTYLRSLFGNDIRCIIPQIAMSAGTMAACIGKEIVMGKHSSIGPIDPQFGGMSCSEVLEEFDRACREIKADPAAVPVWQTMLARYPIAFIGQCEKAVEYAEELVKEWLTSGMFREKPNSVGARVASRLGDHKNLKQHDRHIMIDEARDIGLKIVAIKEDQKFQNILLSLHHCYMNTFSRNPKTAKIIENHAGDAIFYNS